MPMVPPGRLRRGHRGVRALAALGVPLRRLGRSPDLQVVAAVLVLGVLFSALLIVT